jgi:hypothetical protein
LCDFARFLVICSGRNVPLRPYNRISNDAPKALLEKIERIIRLICSKGVGVYFIIAVAEPRALLA